MKNLIGIIALLFIGAIVFVLWNPGDDSLNEATNYSNERTEALEEASESDEISIRTEISDGSYRTVVDESRLSWAGKKPLIDGYINSGSMSLKSGSINVENGEISGELIIDMETLSVSETPTKPGSENALEGHLKGERWFNVGEFPEATFVITESAPREDVETSNIYDITGDLTLKGQTNPVTFPATIYVDSEGLAHADASFEFDRTLWGITSGSGSFFDSLADNVIDDMVALSFELVAEKQ